MLLKKIIMKKFTKTICLFFFCVTLFSQNPTFFIDFGPNDVANGNITENPDVNGNYWNNMLIPTVTGETLELTSINNQSSLIGLEITQDFLMNGIQNGGLLDPDAGLLGEFAIATATQDYFFTTGAAALKFTGMEPGDGFVFSFFGTRNSTSTRISRYALTGINEYQGTLQTSGSDLGGVGYHGNNSTILVSDTIFANAQGEISLALEVVQGGFAYVGLMKLEMVIEADDPVNLPPVADAGEDIFLAAGNTSVTLEGSAVDPDNNPLTYSWVQLNGPLVNIIDNSIPVAQVEGLSNGNSYTFQLSVSDGEFEDTDEVTVVVSEPQEPNEDPDIFRSFYIDFGPNDVINGNITNSPDINGNFWNNVVTSITSGSPVELVDRGNSPSEATVKVIADLLSNGIQNGGLLTPEETLLGDFAIATATQDYFFTVSTGTVAIDNLDPSRSYVFNLFASRNTDIVRISKYVFTGSNTITDTLQTSGPEIGGPGYNGNNSTILTTEPVRPDASGRITINMSVIEGGFAYLNVMRIDEVNANPRYFVDFGPNDVINGNITIGPDENGHYWNNMTNPGSNADSLLFIDKNNQMSEKYLKVVGSFQVNGIQNGGLLEPDIELLGEFAIATATQDYFFTTNTASLEIGGLDPENGYIFSLFGTRNSTSTRITEYKFEGEEEFVDSLQTSGPDLGGIGYNGNNSTVLSTDTLYADPEGKIQLTVNVAEGGFAYLGLMKIEEFMPPAPPEPVCVEQDSFMISVMGSSVAFGVGAINNQGYAYEYTQLLEERADAGIGQDWAVTNISIGGNTTVDVLNRWETDLLPVCGRYVIYGLSLGNEGIHEQGQPAFDQFRDNMLLLIEQSRAQNIEPVVVNCYTRSDFNETDYNYLKEMNLLIHSWDVASINVLGAIDDGTGAWAEGYVADPYHPNTAGHQEFAYAIVPSLFDALHAGKPQPELVEGTYLTIDKSVSDYQLEFTPDAVVHPFTFSFDIKTEGIGVTGGFTTDDGGFGGLVIDENTGNLNYVSTETEGIESNFVINDGSWHKVTLSHYYARGKTFLYVDDQLLGMVDENLEPQKFFLSEINGPTADYRNLLFYRSAMNEEEVSAMMEGDLLKSSLEMYAPLDGQGITEFNLLANLAQSFNELTQVNAYQIITALEEPVFQDLNPLEIFPNPANNLANIIFDLEADDHVKLYIVDVFGKNVASLVNERMSSGKYSVAWELRQNDNPSGLYFCILELNEKKYIRKVLLFD
jgi:lysophospholipase L1-like esterase